MSIINSSLVFITESFIGHGYFLELLASFCARIFIRMKFQCQFSVSFFQFRFRCAGLDAQQIVKLGFLHHFLTFIRYSRFWTCLSPKKTSFFVEKSTQKSFLNIIFGLRLDNSVVFACFTERIFQRAKLSK